MPFDVGLTELVVIFMVVLMVFGPGKLPELAQGLGRLVGDLRQAANDFTRDITHEVGDSEEGSRTSRAQRVCSHCGALSPVGSRFCGQCGAQFA